MASNAKEKDFTASNSNIDQSCLREHTNLPTTPMPASRRLGSAFRNQSKDTWMASWGYHSFTASVACMAYVLIYLSSLHYSHTVQPSSSFERFNFNWDLPGFGTGPQHNISTYRIYRRQYAHEPFVLANYTLWRYDANTLALRRQIACSKAMCCNPLVADLRLTQISSWG